MFSSCYIVCLSLVLSVQVLHTLAIQLGDCKDYEYLLNGDTQCRTCPSCPAGEMYTVHCGYQDSDGKIKTQGLPCEPCPQDTYKSEKSRSLCRDCKLECASNSVVVHQCNATHNLKCSQCKKGFYTEYDGSCMPCMPCYGNNAYNKEYIKQFVKQECVDKEMGSKSCRPIKTTVRPTIFITTSKPMTKMTSLERVATSTNAISKFMTKMTSLERVASSTNRPHVTQEAAKRSAGEREESTNRKNWLLVDPGWLVAVAIGVILVFAIVFATFKYLNIVKRIKVLLQPSHDTTHDDLDDEVTVITVKDRFESPAVQKITNFAELISNDDENQSDCLHHISSINYGTHPAMCTCHHIEEFPPVTNSEGAKASSGNHFELSSDGHDDPWVYRSEADFRQPTKWPLSRAEMGGNAAVLYGEYVELVRSREGSRDCLTTKANNYEPEPACEVTEHNPEEMVGSSEQMTIEEKKGEENSDTEELATSVPVTVGTGAENTVVIATGQHSGMTGANGLLELPKIKSDRTKRKRRKKQLEIKKSRNDSYTHEDELSGDGLQCTCGKCSYRPYVRDLKLCHCPKCVPQPDDDLYKIIERRCLRTEVCKELNKKGVPNWFDLCIYIRIDKQISDIQHHDNPADVVLNMLKTTRPRLKLGDFNVILKKIRRQDIMDVVMNHHITCMLCRRNSFDGSWQDLNQSNTRTGNCKTLLDDVVPLMI